MPHLPRAGLAVGITSLLLAMGALAGVFAPLEGPATADEVSFAAERAVAGDCASGLRAGAAAVDVTPGVKQPDGSYDLWMEEYVDANGNGVYDAPDPVEGESDADPFLDANGNGKWDGPFMAGYGREKGGNEYYIAEGAHDPVWARALVLTCGDVTVGLVSVDTVGLFRGFVLDVRAAAPAELDHVVVAATHTHDSVDTMGLWGPSTIIDGKDPRTMAHYRAGVLQALADGLAAREEVAGVAAGSARTRDLIPVAGPIQTDLRDPFVIDDRVLGARFVRADGSTIATLVNWSPHPETLAGTRSEISSDYADKLRRAVETEGATVGGVTRAPLGGTAVFFSGAVGGMMTTLGAKPLNEDGSPTSDYGYDKAERIGEVAAWAALGAVAAAPVEPVDGLRVQVAERNAPADNAFLLALNALGIFDHEVAVGPVLVPALGEPGVVAPVPFFRVEVNVVTLESGAADLLQALTVPGELLPEVALGNPLSHAEDATLDACYDYVADKKLFNGAREGKINVSGGSRDGWARVLASRPAYPKEPAILDHATGRHVMLLGLANDELGYVVPADDYETFAYLPPLAHGRDRCGDSDHYEETNSASSLLAPVVANALVALLDPSFVPAPTPDALAGFLGADGCPQPIPGWDTRGVWIDTSRSAGFESREDARVQLALPSGLSGCWGFLDGHGEDMGQDPSFDFDEDLDLHTQARGLWIDFDGNCEPSLGDGVLFADAFAFDEGQPHWRP